MRIESSIITSLGELRLIGQQRIALERAAAEREKQHALDEARAAELLRVQREQARVAAEREERVRIEIARAEAEREVRMRVEASEAAERARLAAELEARKHAEEMELRRAEVAKRRPTWMIAVTATALAAAIGLTWFAIERSAAAEHAREKESAALKAREDAKAEVRKTRLALAALEDEVAASDAKLGGLQQKLALAQSAADRRKLEQEVADERRANAERQRKIAAEKAHAAWVLRNQKIDVSKCVDNPTGCLKQ